MGTGLARLSGRLFCWAIIPVISCYLYLGLVLGGIRGGIEDGKGGIIGAPPITLVMGLLACSGGIFSGGNCIREDCIGGNCISGSSIAGNYPAWNGGGWSRKTGGP